jgi:hypothetical protein
MPYMKIILQEAQELGIRNGHASLLDEGIAC